MVNVMNIFFLIGFVICFVWGCVVVIRGTFRLILWLARICLTLWNDNSSSAEAVRKEARIIASRLQNDYFVRRIFKTPIFVYVVLNKADAERKREVMKIFFRHPDFERFRNLRKMDRVSFIYCDEARKGVGRAAVEAYLRLVE